MLNKHSRLLPRMPCNKKPRNRCKCNIYHFNRVETTLYLIDSWITLIPSSLIPIVLRTMGAIVDANGITLPCSVRLYVSLSCISFRNSLHPLKPYLLRYRHRNIPVNPRPIYSPFAQVLHKRHQCYIRCPSASDYFCTRARVILFTSHRVQSLSDKVGKW
jgi:hypothetical protein